MAKPSPNLQRKEPWWMQQDQPWAEEHYMASHVDALYRFGEFVIFLLMWSSQDREDGLVGPCTRCVLGDPLAVGYGEQAADPDCPVCYGTGFEGGFRARIIRPALLSDRDPNTREDRRLGDVSSENLSLETTNDFYARAGDIMIRQDGSRYRLSQSQTNVVRTGFQHPNHDQSIGSEIQTATLQSERSSATYRLPPDDATVKELLKQASLDRHYVVGVGRDDIVRGPLVPPTP